MRCPVRSHVGDCRVRSTGAGSLNSPRAVTELERVAAIELPVARLTIYPDLVHGFLFQHHSRFATNVNAFLAEAS